MRRKTKIVVSAKIDNLELAAGRCSCLDVRALWRGDDPLTL
jgi:hypothetical protein